MFAQRARDNLAAVAFCNLVGGQDELVFDGALARRRPRRARVIARAPQFARGAARRDDRPAGARGRRALRDTRHRPAARRATARGRRRCAACRAAGARRRGRPPARRPGRRAARRREAEVYAALDARPARLRREERLRATSCSASRAGSTRRSSPASPPTRSGPERVDARRHALAATPPTRRRTTRARSPRTSASSCSSCRSATRCRPTTSVAGGAPSTGREPDLTEENLQARIRGNLLMALSNKFGWLVLTTGNKSEMSVGYSTLYGDIAGGFAVIKDVPKTLVYRLVRLSATRAAERASPVPPSIIDARRRAPSCAPTSATTTRCRPTRCSTAILEAYVEEDLGREQLIARGLPRGGRRPRDRAGRPSPSTSAARRRRASRSRRGRSGATGACRSPTATAAERAGAVERPGWVARTAIVIRDDRAQRPSSSVMSTSHTHVVRPRWRRRAMAWMVPVGDRAQERRAALPRPIAILPSA